MTTGYGSNNPLCFNRRIVMVTALCSASIFMGDFASSCNIPATVSTKQPLWVGSCWNMLLICPGERRQNCLCGPAEWLIQGTIKRTLSWKVYILDFEWYLQCICHSVHLQCASDLLLIRVLAVPPE